MAKNLRCGIVGLPNVGKSTLFNALLRAKIAQAENFPFCTIDPNVGIVEVKDPRLQVLAEISKSKKIVYATVAFVDIAGLVKGASKGEGLGNQFLTHIRETDVIIQVVRCFQDEKIIHVTGKIDPVDDIQTIQVELILSDLQMAENILEKLEKQNRGKKEPDITIEVIKKAIKHLNEEKPLRTLTLSDEEKAKLYLYHFLTLKKMLYVANIKEEDLHKKDNPFLKEVEAYATKEGCIVIPLCVKLEEEISELGEAEAKEFLASVNLKESGLDKLIHASFHLLGMITFLTSGEPESRAWTIAQNTKAPEAAGEIHTDLQKGFIKAEVITYEDVVKYKGRVGAREAGKARIEGKEYIVKDGDVILFFHN